MPTLKNITVSNIRRFASDVSIPISRQATIFLAPNGTGKTALFEAIELALTGKVERLNKEIFALVKDGASSASVELDFGEFTQKAVTTSQSEIQWYPSLKLNGSAQDSDISYLLRLTHLLDQRDKSWFIQEEAKTAGSQLAKLPISQEAQKLAELFPKLRKPIKRMLLDKQQDLESSQTKLEQWDGLIEKRKRAQEVVGAHNLTLSKLAEALKPYVENEPKIESIEMLSSLHNVCLSNNYDKLEKAKHSLVGISSLKETCLKFTQVNKKRLALTEKETSLQHEKNAVKLAKDNTITKLQSAEQELSETVATLNSRLSELRNLEKIKAYVKKEEEAKNQIILKLEVLKNLEGAIEEATEFVSKLNSGLMQHKQFEARSKDLKEQKEQLSRAKNSLSLWNNQLDVLREIERELPTLHADLNHSREEVQNFKLKLEKVKSEAENTKIHVASLQKSSEQVRTAVAEIAANIAGKEGDCPVCGEQHGIKELEHRIKIKMKGLDPKLQLLIKKEAQLTQQEATLRAEFDSLIHKQSQLQSLISAKENTLKQCQISIDSYRLDPLFESQEIEGAKETLVKIDNELKNKEHQLTHEALLLPAKPSAEELTGAKQSLEDMQIQSRDHRKFVFTSQEEVKDLQHNLKALRTEIRIDSNQESVTLEISELKALVEDKKSAVQDLLSSSKSKAESIRTLEERISQIHIELKRTETIENELTNSWVKHNFEGKPDSDILTHEINKLQSQIQELDRTNTVLDDLRKKIAHYQGAQALKSLQLEIAEHTAGASETEHRTRLAEDVERLKQELDSLNEKEATINTLSDELKKEIEQIQTKVKSIQPLWQSLLSRVVRESRFSQTALQLETKYNKPHASVNVPLSDLSVNASKIASEAQKTDLQLTFLLSMALANPWSPWRALLLDDPTQHHDLVHASSIFDVLRDFILEFDFQLLMTTHDSVQANYFRRKLENDGVDVTIVNLVPTSDGVRARKD